MVQSYGGVCHLYHAKIPIFEQENTHLIFAIIAEAAANQAAVELARRAALLCFYRGAGQASSCRRTG